MNVPAVSVKVAVQSDLWEAQVNDAVKLAETGRPLDKVLGATLAEHFAPAVEAALYRLMEHYIAAGEPVLDLFRRNQIGVVLSLEDVFAADEAAQGSQG